MALTSDSRPPFSFADFPSGTSFVRVPYYPFWEVAPAARPNDLPGVLAACEAEYRYAWRSGNPRANWLSKPYAKKKAVG